VIHQSSNHMTYNHTHHITFMNLTYHTGGTPITQMDTICLPFPHEWIPNKSTCIPFASPSSWMNTKQKHTYTIRLPFLMNKFKQKKTYIIRLSFLTSGYNTETSPLTIANSSVENSPIHHPHTHSIYIHIRIHII